MKKIIYLLNNENGGPLIETIIGMGVSLGVICGIYYFFNPVFKEIKWIGSITSFYEKK